MTAIRFFTDEDVYAAVARGVRNAGFDAISTPEANRTGSSDESQLQWSTRAGRVLLTFHVAHFSQIHSEWLSRGEHHAGLVLSSQRPIGDVLRRMIHLGGKLDAETMIDRIEFLSDW